MVTDAQVDKILATADPIASVLLSRGGWLKAAEIRMHVAFLSDDRSPAVWCIELFAEGDAPWHKVYVEAATVTGISTRK